MDGTHRQSFDLKTRWGWKNAISRRFNKWARQHIIKDTFGRKKKVPPPLAEKPPKPWPEPPERQKDEKQYYSIWLSKETVIEMLKKDDEEGAEWIKTLDLVQIDEEYDKVYFQGEQFKIIDGVVQKE